MAAPRIFDPYVMKAQGALVDFSAMLRPQMLATHGFHNRARNLFLRWQTSPAVGLPSEPFKVWRRPAMPLAKLEPIGFESIEFPFFFDYNVLQFDEPMAVVSLIVRAQNDGQVTISALAGPPVLDSIVAFRSRNLNAGNTWEIEIQATYITALLLTNVSDVDAVMGLRLADHEKIEGWELVETVGLPVKKDDWSATGQRHGIDQGLAGAEIPAIDAAADRFRRGVNPLGWYPLLPDGVPAPMWEMPDPLGLVTESSVELLPMLSQVAQLPPEQQVAKKFTFTIPPPQSPSGVPMPAAAPGKADISPIGLLALAASTDPMMAVTLGYGTGYLDENIPPLNFGKQGFFDDSTRSDWDWMITGLWEKGLDGRSNEVEFAALVPRPPLAIPAPPPADMKVDLQGHLRPDIVDGPWLASIRASWERFPQMELLSVASFAAAKQATGTAAPAEALLEPRAVTKGFKPIGNVKTPLDPEPTRQSATDGALIIPNNPGSIAMTYAVATQNIFGQWSPWIAQPISVAQPASALVQIVSADLKPTDPGSGSACPATLEIDLVVDWQVRSLDRIELRGHLFSASTRDSTPPVIPPPSGLQRQLSGASLPASIAFTVNVPSMAGATVQALDSQGQQAVTPGPTAQGTSRRYRVNIPDFTLDFAATPHIGAMIQARLVENIAPNHSGVWTPVPRLAYASDPRSRPTTVIDLVRLASLPDAAGECHARIDWSPAPSAIGYALYASTETRILSSHDGFPEPTPDQTLSQRLTTIKQAFSSDPLRRDFIRQNADPLTVTSIDVTLPRGSRDIHLYTIIPISAGGIEGPWPSGPDADEALIPVAAPKVAEPAPPTIEVSLVSDKPPLLPNYRARLRIETRGKSGAPPKRIDIHRVRVDDAARRLDSMGPPITSLMASGDGWTVEPPDDGGVWIATVRGEDQPTGSWRNVWYRAVAWSEDDLQRGTLKGRSLPSPAVAVVIPPDTPPDLSLPLISWPGGDPAAVLVSFASAAPIPPTPLGPHMLTVEALVVGVASPIVMEKFALQDIPSAAPTTGSGVWREAAGSGQYRIILRRAAIADAVSVTIRITDPLGRSSERNLAIAAGSVVPLPTLSEIDAFSITGRGKVFSFLTDTPDNDGMGGNYHLRIELVPAAMPGPLPLTIGGPGINRRLRGGVVGGGIGALTRSQFSLVGGVYVFDGIVGSVPNSIDPPRTGPVISLTRQAAPADDNFSLTSAVKLRSVMVRITVPDGRTVERRRRG